VHPRPLFAWREVLAVDLVLAAFLLVLAGRYGPHRDELYFVSAGDRLAWGYPDQPSFTPLLARMADLLAPGNLVVLRLPSLVAVCVLVALAAGFARLLGGGRAAQALTAVVVAASAVVVALGHRLTTATFDTLAWTAILLIVAHALVDDRPRLWLLAGLVAGVGLNNKHSVSLLLVAVLAAVALVPQTRGRLRSPYPWLGGLLALLLWVPNLLWQAAHDWPVRELSADIAEEYGGIGGRLEMVGQALVMFSPVIAVLWVWGLVVLLRRPEWVLVRPVAVTFLVLVVVLLVTGGKGYYLAGAIPPLIAAGSTALAECWPGRRVVVAGAVLALSAAVAWPAMAPVLPVRTYAASFYTAVDQDQVETIGWPEASATVRGVLDSLPEEERENAVVFTANYGEAGAMEWYDVTPHVYSGHNGWADWGPPPEEASPVVVVGWESPETDFTGCQQRATLDNDADADNEEQGRTVWLCSGVRDGWAERWEDLAHLDA